MKTIRTFFLFVLGVVIGLIINAAVHAQTTNNLLVEEAATVATCPVANVSPAPVILCVTADSHVAVAGNGTTFVTIGAVAAGVTSWNGHTGAVTYTPPTTATGSVSLVVK